jgi:homoserine dehydrogenase
MSYTHYFYEATVGAGLPIISTLRGLLETGDKILRIEGIFRSFYTKICNIFSQNVNSSFKFDIYVNRIDTGLPD